MPTVRNCANAHPKHQHWEDNFDGSFCHPLFGMIRRKRDQKGWSWEVTTHEFPYKWTGNYATRRDAQPALQRKL